jgi:hypothetical protein
VKNTVGINTMWDQYEVGSIRGGVETSGKSSCDLGSTVGQA